MMMIAHNSLVRQKKGDQGEEEEQARARRKGGSIKTSTPGSDAPTGLTRPGVSDTRNRRKHGQRCGAYNIVGIIDKLYI